jgi:Ca-activated chloride channel family protein
MFEMFFQKEFSFQNPEALWLLGLLPLLAFWQWHRERTGKVATLVFSGVRQVAQTRHRALTMKAFRHSVWILRLCALALLIVALARPRLENQKQTMYAEGIDIILVIDLSGSMLAEDFEPKTALKLLKMSPLISSTNASVTASA